MVGRSSVVLATFGALIKGLVGSRLFSGGRNVDVMRALSDDGLVGVLEHWSTNNSNIQTSIVIYLQYEVLSNILCFGTQEQLSILPA